MAITFNIENKKFIVLLIYSLMGNNSVTEKKEETDDLSCKYFLYSMNLYEA